ncbi:hypothetical protein ACFPCW_17385 [Vibrio thalassae]|uniref:hypothetical protein n=1 Tax=Vibrio thalassae TaxID=1243014 RepID=UPI00360A2486
MAALQVLIDRVDASLLAFAEVQTAAADNDVNGISNTHLGNILGLTFNSAKRGRLPSGDSGRGKHCRCGGAASAD